MGWVFNALTFAKSLMRSLKPGLCPQFLTSPSGPANVNAGKTCLIPIMNVINSDALAFVTRNLIG